MITDKYSKGPAKLALTLLMMAAIIIYAAYLVQAIYTGRALYADGANFFVELLTKTSSWPVADDSKHIRLFVNIINQLPIVIALKTGVTDLPALRIYFGMGLFLMPLCFYLYCFYLSRRAGDFRVFYFSIFNLVACAIPSDMFILNQAFTSLALSWIVIHYLLLNLRLNSFDYAAVFVICAILFRAHESLIIWGGIFFLGAVCVKIFRDRMFFDNKKYLIYMIGVFGMLQSGFVAFWQYSHPVGEQTSAFLQLITLLKPSEIWVGNTKISVVMTIALILFFFSQLLLNRNQGKNKLSNIFTCIFLIFILSWMLLIGIHAINDFSFTDPAREYEYRFLITFGSSGWMLLSILYYLYNKPLSNNVKSINKAIICAGVISASLWQISNNLQWSIFTNAASQVLQSSSFSRIDPDNVRKYLVAANNENAYKYGWGWAWTVLGMSLQKNWVVNKLYKPEGYEEYFNPPKRIPFIPMNGDDIASKGPGLYRFEEETISKKNNR